MHRRTDPLLRVPRLSASVQHGSVTSTFDPVLAVRLAALGPLRARVDALLAWLPPPAEAWSGRAQSGFERDLIELRRQALAAGDAIASAQALTGRELDDG